MPGMRRREFVSLFGAAVAWPLTGRAQPAMPVIGFLHSQPPDALSSRMESLRQGLRDMGYAEGENVAIEYRWAENQIDRLPALAADLVRQQVAVIAVVSEPATLAAKAATKTIPIVFGVANDPVMLGLVSSLARPGGNLTGINFFTAELTTKRLELLRELLPSMKRVAVLINPTNAALTEPALKDVQAAGRAMGLEIHLYNASTSREINAAFASLAGERPDALFVGPDPLYVSRRVQLTHLATRHAVPAVYSVRDFAEAGGLLSYGSNIREAWRQVGAYTGRVLKGTKPADLPVVQASKFELVINAETARTFGLTIPASLLAVADEVIE